MDPRWIGMKGALATRSPSGANSAHEKSRRSLIFVLMEVCCSERPIASATLMKRFAKSVSRMGSGPSDPDIVVVAPMLYYGLGVADNGKVDQDSESGQSHVP
jgi:hypothetical protein